MVSSNSETLGSTADDSAIIIFWRIKAYTEALNLNKKRNSGSKAKSLEF